MSLWDDIRQQAWRRHSEALAQTDGNDSAQSLLGAASLLTGVTCVPVSSDDPLLEGGQAVLDIQVGMIWYSDGVDPELALFYQAHEFAHFWLDHAHLACSDADISDGAEGTPSLCTHGVEGYGPRERRECRANVFAREFLLPAHMLRRWFVEEGLDAVAIARRTGLPEGIVFHQLTHAILIAGLSSTLQEGDERHPMNPTEHPLDPSQVEVAQAKHGPVLVEAGPGTGKTRTLVGRIVWLLTGGSAPTSILALTYSNKAADEMRARVARVAGEAAPQIWMGTFHSFGLEVLRKYGSRIGLPPDARVLDATEALFLLESALPSLDLEHYQNLYEPTVQLRDILTAISRAKDECVDPVAYRELVEQMARAATTDEQRDRAAHALEVARVYDMYQGLLEREQVLDFGDLIFKTYRLLRDHPDVSATLRDTYAHVLVDEYQDMNRASSLFLRAFTGDGRGLWVVGDVRQAIYRFRGAAPSNMADFARDFPSATVRSLGRNYRSRPAIVAAFSSLAPLMRATRGMPFTPWEPNRADARGEVMMEIASNLDAEVAGIAGEIERHHSAGTPYREQAVLCRSHTTVERVTERLNARGIPTLYLGNLFNRPEVRDLLALLEFASDRGGSGLLRVAEFREYAIPPGDVLALQIAAREQGTPFPRALEHAKELVELSAAGAAGLAKLWHHLDGLFFGCNAWFLLVHYLFGRSGYLRELARDNSVAGQQRRLAIYQLLRFAYEFRRSAPHARGDSKRALLERVRKLEQFGEEKPLRQVPEGADGVDAVRLMTVHASKGLEFSVVYMPHLGKGFFPHGRRHQPCPPPEGMAPSGPGDAHTEEEECLFFVALSRARDVLCLSRADRYGKQASNPSDLLDLIADNLPRPPAGAATWTAAATGRAAPVTPAPPQPAEGAELPTFPADELDDYMKCPRRYFYDHVLHARGSWQESGYRQFHGCVYTVLDWLRNERASGAAVDVARARVRLAELWDERGPKDSPLEELYRLKAEAMIEHLAALVAERAQDGSMAVREVRLTYGRVTFTPDDVVTLADGTEQLRRIRTGRISSSEKNHPIYALYARGRDPARSPSAAPRQLQAVSLTTGTTQGMPLTDKVIAGRLDRYNDAIAGLLVEAYPPRPEEARHCCTCPHYFTCPAGG